MEYVVEGREEFLGGMEKVTIQRQPSTKEAFGCTWTRVLDDAWATVGALRGAELKLFCLLMGRMNIANRIFLAQKSIAAELGVSNQMVSKSVRKLKVAGVLRGKSPSLMVSPRVVYKGQTADYADVLAKWNSLEN